jgi:hypothetical protein
MKRDLLRISTLAALSRIGYRHAKSIFEEVYRGNVEDFRLKTAKQLKRANWITNEDSKLLEEKHEELKNYVDTLNTKKEIDRLYAEANKAILNGMTDFIEAC